MHSITTLNDMLRRFPSCSTGGPLHIITDDGNVEDHNILFCRDEVEGEHWSYEGMAPEEVVEVRRICNALLDKLEQLSEEERLDALGYPRSYLTDD